jgi:hypothetical protein
MGVGGREMLERLAVEEARVGMAGVMDGVGGPEEAGEGPSTTHILLLLVLYDIFRKLTYVTVSLQAWPRCGLEWSTG